MSTALGIDVGGSGIKAGECHPHALLVWVGGWFVGWEREECAACTGSGVKAGA